MFSPRALFSSAFFIAPFLLAPAVLFIVNSACATIISGSVTAQLNGGVFVKLTVPLSNPFGPPNSVGSDNFESPNLFAFDESQNILLAAPLTVDVGSSPIPAGTVVASHYIIFDPGQPDSIVGTVEFDANVLAIMTSTGTLAASDFLANTGVNYLNPTLRGLEVEDFVSISAPNQITVDFGANTPGDYIRVLTERSFLANPIPEPSTLALLGLGAIGLTLTSRRLRAAA
jgi:hypothetical protein